MITQIALADKGVVCTTRTKEKVTQKTKDLRNRFTKKRADCGTYCGKWASAGKPEIEMDFTLTEGGAIEGWVGTDAGKPIAGGPVSFSVRRGQETTGLILRATGGGPSTGR